MLGVNGTGLRSEQTIRKEEDDDKVIYVVEFPVVIARVHPLPRYVQWLHFYVNNFISKIQGTGTGIK